MSDDDRARPDLWHRVFAHRCAVSKHHSFADQGACSNEVHHRDVETGGGGGGGGGEPPPQMCVPGVSISYPLRRISPLPQTVKLR